MKHATLAIAVLTLSSIVTIGQEVAKSQSSADLGTHAQVSFIYPIGTNGVESYKKSNSISLNIIAGINGSVDGVELAGYMNTTKGHVKGLQGAGFINVVTENVDGVQAAGFANACNKDFTGAQVAGFSNYAGNGIQAMQAAGFVNVCSGHFTGVQASGFANVAVKSTKAFQIAGFVNVAADSIGGGQISGFANLAHKEARGVFASGFLNVCTGKVKGTQVSGFMNVAREVEGSQIGIFNFCDTISKGVPVGFLSFVAKGYHKLELEYSTDVHALVNFKTGTEKFYNILSLGAAVEEDNISYGFGYGLGSNIDFKKRSMLNIDLTVHQLSNGTRLVEDYDILTKLKLNYSYRIADQLSIYAGPSLVVRVQELTTDKEGNDVEPVKADMMIYDQMNKNDYLSVYAALNLGLRF